LILIDTLFVEFNEECKRNGVSWADRLQKNQFSAKLRAAFPEIKTVRPRTGNPDRKRYFSGIRLHRPQRLQLVKPS
jgi:hypothetical protein